jgi:uncharacterized membrane protein required for colicin V production
MNLVDGIIFLVLAWGALRGFSRGLISMACSLAGLLIGVWLAGSYYIPLADFLGVNLGLKKLLTNIFIPFCAGGTTGGTPEVGGLPIFPPSLWEPVQAMQSGISGITMAQLLADSLVKLIAFFIIFALVSAVLGAILGVVANILTRITHLVLLGGVNRLGGMAGGLITNGLFLVVAVGMLTPLVYSFGLDTTLFNNWESSVMVPYFNKSWGAVAPVLSECFKMV